MWKAGAATVVITPDRPLFLAGYGSRRPSEGKRHDLYAKALALEDAAGRRAVLLTSDLVGFSRETCDRIHLACGERYGLSRSELLLTYSHNHCAPVTTGVLPDYYPLAPAEWEQVEEYSKWLESRLVEVIGTALSRLAPAELSAGEGECGFAVNRRNNPEREVPALREAGALHGPVDHSVPVLAVRRGEELVAVVFGYACHPTTLNDLAWCGDYPGYAQLAIEQRHPGSTALFWTGCGGDQNPLPRRSVELCERYGILLADAVDEALSNPLRPLEPELRTAREDVILQFEQTVTREELTADRASENPIRARWARRLLAVDDPALAGCPYGVQAWRLGDQLWIALGGEAVVDYAIRLRREYGDRTWVTGYAHDMVGYVPTRRVWREGGYEAGYLYEYGWPAHRWTEDTEDRILAAVQRVNEATGQ